MNKLRKAVKENPENVIHVTHSLVDWYSSWQKTFDNFNEKNAKNYIQNQPFHTWLHCLMTGNNEIYQKLKGEEIITVKKSRYEELISRERQTFKPLINETDKANKLLNNEKLLKLERLYEKDKELKLKILLMDKKIAVFHESNWSTQTIDAVKQEYYFETIDQFPAVKISKTIGNYDYYIMLTSRASHSTKNILESKIEDDRIFFIDADNIDRVMSGFIFQLEGKIDEDGSF